MPTNGSHEEPHAAEPPDVVLVRRGQAGDAGAVVTLYHRYVHEVYGFVYHQLGSRDDADDVTSETFLQVVRALKSFQGRSSFRTWLYTVARNQVRDHWRRSGRHRTVTLQPDTSIDEASPLARAEVTALGQSVLSSLPDNYRRVIELRVMGDRTVRETAAEMGTTEGNVKVMLHRALKRAAVIAAETGEAP